MIYYDTHIASIELRSTEQISQADRYRISFEPAVHVLKAAEYDQLRAQWETDNWYHAHGWDPVSANRVGQVGADVFGIDSFTYTPDYPADKGNTDTFAWLLLPAPPSHLNTKGEIYLPTVDIFQNTKVQKNTSLTKALLL